MRAVGEAGAAAVGGAAPIVSAGPDRAGRIRDHGSGAEQRPPPGHSGWVSAVAVGALGGADRIVSAGQDGTVRIWDPDSGLEALDTVLPDTGGVLGVAIMGDRVVAVGTAGMVVVVPLVDELRAQA